VVLAAALVLVGASAGPARAADVLLLSTDGTRWSASLPDQVFDDSLRAVPGDVLAATLWVRNASEVSARVELTVADGLGAAPGRLAGDLGLTIDGDRAAGGARWTGPELAAGATVRIPLVVTFSAASASLSRLDTAAVLSAVTLVQTGPDRAAAPGTPGTLARTGSDAVGGLGVAGGALGLGLLLVLARRRARHQGR